MFDRPLCRIAVGGPIARAAHVTLCVWIVSLVSGFAGLAGLAALAGCEREGEIGLRPVELLDPRPGDPFDTDPLLTPAPLACSPCREWEVVLASGDVVRVRGADVPSLRIRGEDVSFVELAQASSGVEVGLESVERTETDPAKRDSERLGVFAVLEPAGRDAWSVFASEHAKHFVLVEVDGRPVDLFRPLGWARGLRLGVFADEAAGLAFVAELGFVRSRARGS
jgi:hypothetical protein